jgi:DNA-binding GntR family transcriptional regulator
MEQQLGLRVTKRRVLSDEVTDDIRAAILSHQLEPGRKLSEDELALQVGVSRGPIREALARLEREGLVIIERHKGARVASWSLKDIEEIYSMRSALEELAIEWACRNATTDEINEMKNIIKNWEKMSAKHRTAKEVSLLDLEFHSVLFKSAHHARLLAAWEGLRSQMHAFFAYLLFESEIKDGPFRPTWGKDHRKILELIEQKKVPISKREIHQHVEIGYQGIIKHFHE